VRVLVAGDPAREQQIDEIRRLCRAADLPLRPAAPAHAKQRAHLLEDVVDLLATEALPLDGVPGLPEPHAERVAIGLDPLVARPERPEGVRVFRELA
jgi:hypothetical protein